jgi:hypothetical protein
MYTAEINKRLTVGTAQKGSHALQLKHQQSLFVAQPWAMHLKMHSYQDISTLKQTAYGISLARPFVQQTNKTLFIAWIKWSKLQTSKSWGVIV